MRMIRSGMEKYDKLAVENKDLALELKLLRSSMACPPQEGAEAKEEVGSYTKEKELKGFDHKSNPKPDQYGMEQEKFQEWDELLKAMMVAIDDRWEDILTNIQSEGKKVMTPERMDEVLITSGVGVDDHRKAKKMLYVTLLAYTKDDALVAVKSA